jgi:hypothetical protein
VEKLSGLEIAAEIMQVRVLVAFQGQIDPGAL